MSAFTEYLTALNTSLSRKVLKSPARMSILAFGSIIFAGALLLMLPCASRNQGISFIDALFTSTSATCVTGLTVVSTSDAFSPLGQVIVLVLIQTGGLGIMTLSTFFLLMAGGRPSLTGRVLIQDSFTQSGDKSLSSILRDAVLFTMVLEGAGMILLFLRFLPGSGIAGALYLSAFHSISAFCNAGFSLFSEGLLPYREDWVLNSVVCVLVICGGIGFLVFSELRRQFPFTGRTWSRLSLHSKLVLSTTAVLLLVSTLLIIIMEWHNTLRPLSVPLRFMAAFFHAVSARTAGFNTLVLGEMANETLFILMLLMFIGASPGSCAGGIKTTTMACLAVLGISRLRGLDRPRIFHRTLSRESAGKAVSIVLISVFVVIAATLGLLMTELGEVPHSLSRGKYLELLFEAVSAFGTVGLSTGITEGLSTAGKLIITLLMFIGRLGPLAIAVAVSRSSAARYYYAEEAVMIG